MMERRVKALVGHWIAAYEGVNAKTPHLNPSRGQRCGAVAICGARLVPWRPLQPSQEGFNSPALHHLIIH